MTASALDEPTPTALQIRAAHVVRAAARVVLLLLTIRVGLLLFAPQPDDQRIAWFLGLTQVLIDPFRPLMRTVFIDPWNGSILDTLALAAMIGYALLEAVLVRAIFWHRRPRLSLPPLPPDLLESARAHPPARTNRGIPGGVPTSAVAGAIRRVRRN